MLIDRRTFLKSLGLLGASSVAGCSKAPAEKLYAYLTPPMGVTPGVAAYYATICRACPAGCGVIAKTREGRPIKLEGNPKHPVNKGKLCARGQAFIYSLYGKHRAREPMIKEGGTLKPIKWEKALNEVSQRLKLAKSTALLTGLESGSMEDLLGDFTKAFGGESGGHTIYEPLSMGALAKAAEILFGFYEIPRFDISKADYLISLGADFLDAWLSPVELTGQWAEAHAFSGGRKLKMEYAGARRNLTATAADYWHKVRPNEIPVLAIRLLREVFNLKKDSLEEGEASVISSVINGFGALPNISLSEEAIKVVSRRLAAARRGTIIVGGLESASEGALAANIAMLLINRLTGALGDTIRFGEGYAQGKAKPASKALELVEKAAKGAYDLLFVYGANPVYSLPASSGKKLERAKFTVSLAYELDETALASNIVLPVHHPLESWGDFEVSKSVTGFMQPVRTPLFDTKHIGDLLIELASRAEKPLPKREFKEYVVSRWEMKRAEGSTNGSWEEALVCGGEFKDDLGENKTLALVDINLDKIPKLKDKSLLAGEAISLMPAASNLLYDGRGALCDHLLETPDSVYQTSWEIPVEVSLDLATKLKIKEGDILKIKSVSGEGLARAVVAEDMAENSVAIRMGGGREVGEENLVSLNVFSLLEPSYEETSGEFTYAANKVTIEPQKRRGGIVSVSGGSDTEKRLLCLSVPLKDARENKYPIMTRHGEAPFGKAHGAPVPMPHNEKGGERPGDNIVPLIEKPEHRWGMVVDLDKCVGCGACVVACNAENNIPSVGREEVEKGRELHWIRIEKHFFKNHNTSKVRFLPVMCQHCDQAPCETVCPVFASYHTPDGLNAQAYNRCIGTRYCANNCPYKARRFNYWDYKHPEPGNQQLNPDVTVRPRGVMEKCTFCIQRIREVTNRAKAEGRKIEDGEIQPACVQTCPSGALYFGDFKQSEWQMTRIAKDPRGYRLLDWIVNTRPGVVYLRKVITGEEEA